MYYLGIDIGGTNTVCALVDEAYRVLAAESFKTAAPRPAEALCGEIRGAMLRLCERLGIGPGQVAAAGAGCPGLISGGVCHFAGNLGFSEVPLAALLTETLGIPAVLCNDANAAAFGEHIAGCGRGKDSLVMLTIGTGIGGGVVLNNELYEGAFGFGGEVGHFVIRAGGRRCSCGSRGCLETYCSASALLGDARRAMGRDHASLLWTLAPEGRDLGGEMIFQAAAQGDPAARRTLDRFLDDLSIGIYNLIVLFQPHVICVGGGMSAQGETLLAPLRRRLRENPLGSRIGDGVELLAATLRGDAGVIGAAALAGQRMNSERERF